MFFDWKDIVHYEFVRRGQMVNKQLYQEILARLRDAVHSFIYFRSVDPYRGVISHGYRTCQKKLVARSTYKNMYSISYN